MASTHTSGNWVLHSTTKFPVRIETDDPLPTHICEMTTVNPEMFANARLITAAPDLLAACIAMLNKEHELAASTFACVEFRDLEAAIEKATK